MELHNLDLNSKQESLGPIGKVNRDGTGFYLFYLSKRRESFLLIYASF